MKRFEYPMFQDGEDETLFNMYLDALKFKVSGIFNFIECTDIRHLSFGIEGKQMRRTVILEAPKCFTKDAIYTVMNAFKAQPLKFI